MELRGAKRHIRPDCAQHFALLVRQRTPNMICNNRDTLLSKYPAMPKRNAYAGILVAMIVRMLICSRLEPAATIHSGVEDQVAEG